METNLGSSVLTADFNRNTYANAPAQKITELAELMPIFSQT
jgi:hypothetical protein